MSDLRSLRSIILVFTRSIMVYKSIRDLLATFIPMVFNEGKPLVTKFSQEQ